MKKVEKRRCPSCHTVQHTTSNFCAHCGHQLRTARPHHTRTCPHCTSTVPHGAAYCSSCGGPLRHTHKHTFSHTLLYTIIFLLILLILFIFFSLPIGYPPSDIAVDILPAAPTPLPLEHTTPTTAEPTTIIVPPKQKTYEYSTTTWVHAYQNFKSSEGQGTETVTFPDTINYCKFHGNWNVDSAPTRRLTRYCNGATGTFLGYADAFTQHVTNDPDNFAWNSKTKQNPPAIDHDAFSLYMNTCSTEYYRTHSLLDTNVVSARFSGFGTTTLTIDWDYRDITTKPAVDFFITLDCTLNEQ